MYPSTRIFSPSGLLLLAAPLDYESERFHHVTVRAMDHGLPSLSSTQTLTVAVRDVNDHPPVFSQSVYDTSVLENRDPGEPVVRVSATDKDSGDNQELITGFVCWVEHKHFLVYTWISLCTESEQIFEHCWGFFLLSFVSNQLKLTSSTTSFFIIFQSKAPHGKIQFPRLCLGLGSGVQQIPVIVCLVSLH